MGRPIKYLDGRRTIVKSISLDDAFVEWIEGEAKKKNVTVSGLMKASMLAGYEDQLAVAMYLDKLQSLVNNKPISNNDNQELKNRHILRAIYQVFNEPNKDNLLVKDRMITAYKLNHSIEYDTFVIALLDYVKNKIASYNTDINLEENEKLIKSMLETELRKIKVE